MSCRMRLMNLFAVACLFEMGCAETPRPTDSRAQTGPAENTSAARDGAVSKSQDVVTAAPRSDADVTPGSLETPSPDGMNWLTSEEVADGWLRLFDGQTLFGWKPNSPLVWKVENGVITAASTDAKEKGLLVSTCRFANYELRCDYRLEKGGNSGIFLRTAASPTDPAVDCYELNMCDTHPEFGTASLVKRIKPDQPIEGDGDWHSFLVTVDGPKVLVNFDGKQVLQYEDTTPKPLTTGHIGLQMNGGKIEFRNIYLRPLAMKPLFDGFSLTGWRVVPGSKSRFHVQDGAIHVTDGRGFLETESTSGNFVLQFEALTHGDKLNSGVFFRAVNGTEAAPSDGYEFQIQNGFKDGDRNKPEDFGTGAIFRRIPARRVVANDKEWFSCTLLADGLHFATWVNGTQVVDWTDERPAHKNPREGSRAAPGHFSLQGHDPTTDLEFRKLQVSETPD